MKLFFKKRVNKSLHQVWIDSSKIIVIEDNNHELVITLDHANFQLVVEYPVMDEEDMEMPEDVQELIRLAYANTKKYLQDEWNIGWWGYEYEKYPIPQKSLTNTEK